MIKWSAIKLRTQILIFLFTLGILPMVALTVFNLPLVLDKLESFVHRQHLQNLRADFSDLEQHIASRKELVRLLAKVSLPKEFSKNNNAANTDQFDPARNWFTHWVNQLLRSSLDVLEVFYLDKEGNAPLHLLRNSAGASLAPIEDSQKYIDNFYFKTGISVPLEEIFVGPIKFGLNQNNPTAFMTMHMVSPIISFDGTLDGVVIIKIDVGALPNVHPNTLWAHDNGNYLHVPGQPKPETTAFEDYPGLAALVPERKLTLWRGEDRQVIWVPLFQTEQSGLLWVGRPVDPSSVETFRKTLHTRVLVIIAALVVVILLVSNFLASKADRFGQNLINGVEKVLNNEENVNFSWQGPKELVKLSTDLNSLAHKHIEATNNLVKRAQELEESNRYKSQFLANMSHELRTPLNSIILLSKIMASNDNQNLSAVQVKQSVVIHQAGNNLLSMINDILDISKIEAQKTTFLLSHVVLADLPTLILSLFEPLAEEKSLYIKHDIESDVPASIVTDYDKLSQILKNFLSNAIKFTHQGGVMLMIANNVESDHNQRPIVIKVSDTGIGIPQEKQEIIFEAFRQADGSTSRQFGGTGLGLTISSKAAALMGGRISVSSIGIEGQGAEFKLFLPLAFDTSQYDSELITYMDDSSEVGIAESQDEIILVNQGEVADYKISKLKKKTILLIEDQLPNLLILTPMFEKQGMHITAAATIEELEEIVSGTQCFDYVFLNSAFSDLEIKSIIVDLKLHLIVKNQCLIVYDSQGAHQMSDHSVNWIDQINEAQIISLLIN